MTRQKRYQPRVKGGRQPLPACVIGEIFREVDRIAVRFRCSRSWVVATALADAIGIDIETFDADQRKRRRRRAA